MTAKNKEKGNIAFLMIFILVIIGVSGFLFYRYRSSDALIGDLQKRLFGNSSAAKVATTSSQTQTKTFSTPTTTSSQITNSSSTTKTQSNTNFYRGRVLNISENKSQYRYVVTLQPQDDKGNNTGKTITFNIPIYPPKTNSSTLGKDFKQMIDKGYNPINIVINNDDNNRFLSWESLK